MAPLRWCSAPPPDWTGVSSAPRCSPATRREVPFPAGDRLFGASLAIGNFDGDRDGVPELAVGEPGHWPGGAVVVFSGGAGGFTALSATVITQSTSKFRSGLQDYPGARRWDIVLVEADASGPRRLRLSQTGDDSSIDRPCPGASYRLADGLLTVVVPQSCFGRYAGTVRVATQVRSRADLVGSDGYAYVYRTPDIDYTDRTS